MSETCKNCGGKCCRGEIPVHKKDEIYTDKFLTNDFNDTQRVMKLKHNGDCICLLNGRCVIYQKRPIECKIFKEGSKCCEEFKSGVKDRHNCSFCHITQLAKESLM